MKVTVKPLKVLLAHVVSQKKSLFKRFFKEEKKPAVVFVRHGDFPVFEAEARQLIVC